MPGRKSRRSKIRPASTISMILVAGLPKLVYKDATLAFGKKFPHTIIKGTPASNADGRLYGHAYVSSLIRSASEFVVRRYGASPAPTPSAIVLLYVPAPDQENLLRAFDFTVMPVAMSKLCAWSAGGIQLRHDRSEVEHAMASAWHPSSAARLNINKVSRRVNRFSDNEAMLLPPRNFNFKGNNLVSTFQEYRNGEMDWNEKISGMHPVVISRSDMPNLPRGPRTRRPFVDSSGIAFFIANPSAYHGNTWETAENDLKAIIKSFRGLYRFGCILPQGIHHDAQRLNGRTLDGHVFNCVEKGRIKCISHHANIYPNDFVRVRAYEKLE